MKTSRISGLATACVSLLSTALAGTSVLTPASTPVASTTGFENAIRPISNPTLFDSALPGTNIHPIFMYQQLPNTVHTELGNLPLGGDLEVYALQAEFAVNERLSIVATKDGYVTFHPDNKTLWSKESGFANIGAGLKYAFIYDPANSTAVSGTATFEIPTGDSEVFQGEGDGSVNLILSGLKLWDKFELAGAGGVTLPFSDDLSTTSFVSAHASYRICPWFIPLVETNWYHVISDGNGEARFSQQAGGAVPIVIDHEGGDLLNLGGSNATENADQVTAAFGFRSVITSSVDVGAAYEIPLTAEDDGLLKSRVTVDLVWKF
jgi:Putative MetA-pathway of phenol degradation